MATTSWEELPDVALINVFLCLSDRDRLNLACTCKNWTRLFSTSVLWRQRRIVFDCDNPLKTAENEMKFLDNYGHYLNKLSINFGRPSFKTCMNISKAAERYLTRVTEKNIQLKELDLEAMHMEQNWHFILSRNRLVTAICKMVRKMKFLETVCAAGARMKLVDGCRILEAMSKHVPAKSITYIYIEDFFETSLFPFRNPRYVRALSAFLALKRIHLNYRYVSPEVLRNFGNRLGHCLENVSLVMEGDVRGVEIPSEAWYEFREKCPRAEIDVYLCTTILRGNDLRSPFVRGMPLSQCYLTSWSRIDETEQRLANLLRHLGNLYHETLENFAMFFEHHEAIDMDLLYMLGRCRNIKDLCLQARISADSVVNIMTLQHDGVLSVKSINLTIPGLSDEEWTRIEAEKQNLLATVSDFCYVGPNEFGSSIGGSTLIANMPDENEGDNDNGHEVVLRFLNNNLEIDIDISDDEEDLFLLANNNEDEEEFLL